MNLPAESLSPSSSIQPDELVQILYEELEHAIRWERPSILLVVYNSELVRARVEDALGARLAALQQAVVRMRVSEVMNNVPRSLTEHEGHSRAVFFVSGLRWGGGRNRRESYRALNLYRELFVENSLRVVFWLISSEMVALMKYAPDFWAFRHRVLDLTEDGEPERKAPVEWARSWWEWGSRVPLEDSAQQVAHREKLLAELPADEAAMPARVDLCFQLGRLYWTQSRSDQAIERLKQGLAFSSTLPPAMQANLWAAMGMIYHDQGRLVDAVTSYQQAIALSAGVSAYYSDLSCVLREQGLAGQALEAADQATQKAPLNARAWNNLANLYVDRGELDAASGIYRKAGGLQPRGVLPWTNLAGVLVSMGRLKDAIAAQEKAARLEPSDLDLRLELGILLRAAGLWSRAIRALRKATRLDPACARAWLDLGDTYALEGRWKEALSAYRQAAALEPAGAEVLVSLASSFRALGREGDARKNLAAAAAQIESAGELVQGRDAFLRGDPEAAVRILGSALNTRQVSSAWLAVDPHLAGLRSHAGFIALIKPGQDDAD